MGTEDDFVVGDNLVLHSDSYPIYEFDKFSAHEFEEIFSPDYAEWRGNDTKKEIREHMLNFGG
jgi:hypothetical protein